jgi:hypothetical protein
LWEICRARNAREYKREFLSMRDLRGTQLI